MFALLTVEEVLQKLSSTTAGISEEEVKKHHEEYGYNELPKKRRSLFLLFLKQFRSVLVFILIGALVLSLVLPFYEAAGELTFTDFFDAIAIAIILLLNAALGFLEERKAENAIALLAKMSEPKVRVKRNGEVGIIPSRELVPGDILLLEEGDTVSADARVIEARSAAVNEASLTGESKPSRKTIDVLSGTPAIADQLNMVFRGTVVTAGHLTVIVTAIGPKTEIGKIAALVSEMEHPPTPLERSMAHLGKWLGIVVVACCGIIFFAGVLRDLPFAEMLLAAASLAVSAVPEGLPAIVTVCLAIGVQRMIRRNVLTRELSAIETLGSITVICSDKTGTITENEMEVQELWVDDASIHVRWEKNNERVSFVVDGKETTNIRSISPNAELLLQIGASANNAHSLTVGDPTEIGLLEIAQRAGVERMPILEEDVPFSSEKKYMMTTHRGEVQYIKGAPEMVVDLCNLTKEERENILTQNASMAARALRILACAYRDVPFDTAGSGRPTQGDTTSQKAHIIGLIGMIDPPRDGVKEAIAIARDAGIRTVMITGDNALTAQAVAELVGISGGALTGKELDELSEEELTGKIEHVRIFARVSPTHKVRILKAFQDRGEIVAMGGDGVNDAPALKKADVGFAMGKKGTDVARDTAQIVLTDDHFQSVVSAVEEGRTIYDNINKFVVFLLRANFDELLVVLGAVLFGIPVPFLPIHILLINLMTDSLPAMALALEKPEPDIMRRPPRNPKEHILHGEIGFIIFAALIAAAAAFHIFHSAQTMFQDVDRARTMVVTGAIMFELLLVFTCRSKQSLLVIGPFSNRYLLGAVAIAFGILLICLYTPLNVILHLVPLTFDQWLLPLAWSAGALLFFEILKVVLPKRRMTW